MDKKIVLQIPTNESRKEELKKVAKKNGYTMSGLVNKLIADYLKKEAK